MRRHSVSNYRDWFALHFGRKFIIFRLTIRPPRLLAPTRKVKSSKRVFGPPLGQFRQAIRRQRDSPRSAPAAARIWSEIGVEFRRIGDLPLRLTEALDLHGKVGPGAAKRPAEPLPRGRGHANGQKMDMQNPNVLVALSQLTSVPPIRSDPAKPLRSRRFRSRSMLPVESAVANVPAGKFQGRWSRFRAGLDVTSRWRATCGSVETGKRAHQIAQIIKAAKGVRSHASRAAAISGDAFGQGVDALQIPRPGPAPKSQAAAARRKRCRLASWRADQSQRLTTLQSPLQATQVS